MESTSFPTKAIPASGKPAVRAFSVDVISGPDAGLQVRSEDLRLVVGTHRSADLVLSDPTVSRFHLELSVDRDALSLRDLGSKNGTVVDSIELDSARLRGPTILALGETELRVDLLAETVELKLAPQEHFGKLVGVSQTMRQLFLLAQKAAASDAHILIEGEAGTGKDALAAELHAVSPRAEGPLDVVECSRIGMEIEAELFGRRHHPGVLERCHGGTVILHEVSALPQGTQRSLCQYIETGEVRRLGSTTGIPIDVRIIAMSRSKLWQAVNQDRFRSELFQLLSSFRLALPPLRDRPEDIPLLIAHTLDRLDARDSQAGAKLLASDSVEALRGAPWLDNVRELQSYVDRYVSADGDLEGEDEDSHPPLIDGSLPLRDARKRWVRYFERSYLRDLLKNTSGNISAAAISAGVDRVHIHRLITRCGLREELSQAEKES